MNKYKIAFLGTTFVGKTTLISTLMSLTTSSYTSTIGIDFFSKTIPVSNSNNKNIVLQFWDTAGQERFNSITINYLRGCFICVIVFDLTELDSLDFVQKYIDMVEKENGEGNVEILIVGNKKDLTNISLMADEGKDAKSGNLVIEGGSPNVIEEGKKLSSNNLNQIIEESTEIINSVEFAGSSENNDAKEINDLENYKNKLQSILKNTPKSHYLETTAITKQGIKNLEDKITLMAETNYNEKINDNINKSEELDASFQLNANKKRSWFCF